MTTLRELGEYLIEVADNGRVIELRDMNKITCGWSILLSSSEITFFDTAKYEYRLKPKVTYYRAYMYNGLLTLDSMDVPWNDVEQWKSDIGGDRSEHIHDFEISE